MPSAIAVFPGSFDPITIGHVDIVKRALPLFDRVIIAIGENSNKKYLFSLDDRLRFIQKIFEGEQRVETAVYSGLTVDFAKKAGAGFILRGIRTNADFDFEKTIAHLNKTLDAGNETVFLPSRVELSHISSTIVREIYINNGDISKFVHASIVEDIKRLQE